jgi:DNA-binding LacI/PurR family transcriptional regulator
VSVVGFDDVPESAYYVPPLTTVRQDFAELGRRGVALVLARLGGGDHQSEPVEPQLVVRSTTGPPPSPRVGRRRPRPTSPRYVNANN